MEDKEQFLNYTGEYKEVEDDEKDENKVVLKFKFGNEWKVVGFLGIVPPVYDVPFKTIFSYDKEGMEITKDFLNSLLFPKSKSIEEICSFTSKELLSKYDNIKYNNGTRYVDDAFIVKLKGRDKKIIIDLEMEKNFRHSLTEKFYDYGNGLRRANQFMETWVIAICMDKSKSPQSDKSSQTYALFI